METNFNQPNLGHPTTPKQGIPVYSNGQATSTNQEHQDHSTNQFQNQREPFSADLVAASTITKVQNQNGTTSVSKSKITDYLPPISTVAALRDNLKRGSHQGFDNQQVSSTTQNDKVSHTNFQLSPQTTSPDGSRPSNYNSVSCKSCGSPYPASNISDDVPAMINNLWECGPCQENGHARLIAELKEKAKLKILEREQRELNLRKQKEENRLKREAELQHKRDAKEQQKNEARQKRAEIAAKDGQKLNPLVDSTEDNIGEQSNSATKKTVQTQLQLNGVDSGPKQTTLRVEKKKSRPKPEQALTQAEKEKLEEKRVIKQQMMFFSKHYSELVEKNSIKYPIEDNLIKKLPELHGAFGFPPKPSMLRVLISSEEFEQLLYIWEFCNNFSDYLETPSFKIEDLKIALTYQVPTDQTIQEEEELEWNEQMTLQQVRDKGLNLINDIHSALNDCYLEEIAENEVEEPTDNYLMLQSVQKLLDDKVTAWPEICRLILINRLEEVSKEEQDYMEAFGEYGSAMKSIMERLAGMQPNEYSKQFGYQEKIILLQMMIDGIHDLQSFKELLAKRVEEKTVHNKEKMEIIQSMKQLEADQADILKKQQEPSFVEQRQANTKELEELTELLANSSRADSKKIKERINQLNELLNQYEYELSQIETQIKKKQAQIDKVNEKSFQVGIRTNILGKDADRHEYWHFKEDSERIYVRFDEPIFSAIDPSTGLQYVVDHKFAWFYIEEEDKYEQLIESLNPKGIREKKLQENLKKMRVHLKLTKAKKSQQKEKVENIDEQAEVEEIKSRDAQEVKINENVEMDEPEQHVVFQTDDYKDSLSHAVWFGKKIPPKRKFNARGATKLLQMQSSTDQSSETISLEQCKTQLCQIAKFYTESSKPFDREWDDIEKQRVWEQQVRNAKDTSTLSTLILQLNDGMSLPTSLIKREDRIQKFKLQFFKFWPNQELKKAWTTYTQQINENLTACTISLKMLEQTTNQFSIRQQEKGPKKPKAERVAPVQDTKPPVLSRWQRMQQKGEFVKYFQSSESEEEESKSKVSESVQDYSSKSEKVNLKKKPGPKRNARKIESSEEESEEDSEEDQFDSPKDSDTSREWDEYCFVCQDGGNVICCDGCTNVAHLSCLKIKSQPAGDWHCKDCLVKIQLKQSQKGTRRSVTNQNAQRIDTTTMRASSRSGRRR